VTILPESPGGVARPGSDLLPARGDYSERGSRNSRNSPRRSVFPSPENVPILPESPSGAAAPESESRRLVANTLHTVPVIPESPRAGWLFVPLKT
jgi:hypothetical protein